VSVHPHPYTQCRRAGRIQVFDSEVSSDEPPATRLRAFCWRELSHRLRIPRVGRRDVKWGQTY
jgi:hypothetical protein